MCSVNNEAVLKALFKVKYDELDFNKAINIAIQTEDAAKVARETVHGTKTQSVQQVKSRPSIPPSQQQDKSQSKGSQTQKGICYRCGGNNHHAQKCNFTDTTCNFCKITGHLERVCRQQQATQKASQPIKRINLVHSVLVHEEIVPKLEVTLDIEGSKCLMELDTATTCNFLSRTYWEKMGCPPLDEPAWKYV